MARIACGMYPASAGNMVALLRGTRLVCALHMSTYINRKMAIAQYGVDPRQHEWEAQHVQERPKGTGKEKWYWQDAVAKLASKDEPTEGEGVVVLVVPDLPKLTLPCNKEEVLHSVVVAKRAMNFRFVIGTKGEVVRVQDNKRVKIGMRLAVREDLVTPGQYVTKEAVR